jgi:hypothetical protein
VGRRPDLDPHPEGAGWLDPVFKHQRLPGTCEDAVPVDHPPRVSRFGHRPLGFYPNCCPGVCGSNGLMVRLADLEAFVVAAKSATYVGSGSPAESSRPGSRDLTFEVDDWLYRDSYFGGTNFLGHGVASRRAGLGRELLRLHPAARHDRRRASRCDDPGRVVGDVSGGPFPG